MPSDEPARCVVDFNEEGICGGQGFVSSLVVFNGPRLEIGWNLLPLKRKVWEPRIGMLIDPELLAEMTSRERRAVCTTTRGVDATGRSACMIVWCNPSAGSGLEGPLIQETHSGVHGPKERVCMSNQKKQSTEAAVREIRRRSRRKFSPEE